MGYISCRCKAEAILIVHSPLRLLVLGASVTDRNRPLACPRDAFLVLPDEHGQPSFLFLHFNAFLEKFERKPWEPSGTAAVGFRERAAVRYEPPKNGQAGYRRCPL